MDSGLKLWVFSLLLVYAISCAIGAKQCICQPVINGFSNTQRDCKATEHPATSFDLYFTEKGTKDYVVHHGLKVSNAFTVCYRVRTTETTTDRTVFSYATSSSTSGNEIWLTNQPGGKMRIAVDDIYREVSFTASEDGSWHHICTSWENVKGEYKFYRDGVPQGSGLDLKKGYVISSAGTLVIAQDQDIVGGDFTADQCYVGELTDLNVWDRVLSPDEISEMSRSCHSSVGNVKKWADFRAGIRGNVKVLTPSTCKA